LHDLEHENKRSETFRALPDELARRHDCKY
jgi:hypothetical protein